MLTNNGLALLVAHCGTSRLRRPGRANQRLGVQRPKGRCCRSTDKQPQCYLCLPCEPNSRSVRATLFLSEAIERAARNGEENRPGHGQEGSMRFIEPIWVAALNWQPDFGVIRSERRMRSVCDNQPVRPLTCVSHLTGRHYYSSTGGTREWYCTQTHAH